jgi:hypothetical protein
MLIRLSFLSIVSQSCSAYWATGDRPPMIEDEAAMIVAAAEHDLLADVG